MSNEVETVLPQRTALNQELTAIDDGNKLNERIAELGYKGIQLKDLDTVLLSEILDSFTSYHDSYKCHVNRVKDLQDKLDCMRANLEVMETKFKNCSAELSTQNQKVYDLGYKLESTEGILASFQKLIDRFC